MWNKFMDLAAAQEAQQSQQSQQPEQPQQSYGDFGHSDSPFQWLNQRQSSPYANDIQSIMTAWGPTNGWGPKQQKYSDRIGDYFSTLEKNIGSPISDISLMSGPQVKGDKGGFVYRAKADNGQEYVVEIPHSPGGLFFDYNTSGMPGWSSLGLGDLGGEGNEKIPGSSAASYIPMSQYTGLPGSSAMYLPNVNPKGSSGLGDLAKLAAIAAAVYTGGASLGAWGAGAGAAGAGAGGAALGSGISAGGGLGLTAGGGLGLTGTIGGLGSMGAGGALTAAGLAGTGLGAGWASGLGSAAASAAGTGGGNMGLWDSITSGVSDFGSSLSNLFSTPGSGESSASWGSPEWMAAQDYADFGVEGVNALGNSLGASQGVDWASPFLTEAQISGMLDSTPGLLDYAKKLLPQNPGSTLRSIAQSIFGGSGAGGAGSTDWMRALGSLGAAGVGAYAANQQTNSLEKMAERYEGYGAPYRQRLSDLYADPDSFLSSKEVRTPVDQGTQSLMRSLSTQGNPFGSGNALQQGQSYASDQLFGRLGQEKDRLAGFGGLSSYNQAAPQAATNAIQSGSGSYQAGANAIGNIFNPPQTPAQQAAEWMKVMGR